MNSIVTLTMNPAIDASMSVDRVVPMHKLTCGDYRRDPGGGGLNVARALAKIGEEPTAVYCAGGLTGELLGSLLDRESVNRQAVSIDGETRENTTVTDLSEGRQYRFGLPGPEMAEKDWRRVLEILTDAGEPDYLVASGSLPPGVPADFYARLAGICAERKTRLVLDAKGEPLRLAAATDGLYLVKPNLRELRGLIDVSGAALTPERMAGMAAEAMKADVVLISLGGDGAIMVSPGERIRLRPPKVEMCSHIGAGDSMVAGMIAGLVRGKSLRDAARLAVAAGTAAVLTPATELCRGEDVERLFDQVAIEPL